MQKSSKLVPLVEACFRTGVDYNQVHRRILRGEIPAVRGNGRAWFIAESYLPQLAALLGSEAGR